MADYTPQPNYGTRGGIQYPPAPPVEPNRRSGSLGVNVDRSKEMMQPRTAQIRK